MKCVFCDGARRAVLRRPKTGRAICRECFFAQFEAEVHETITRSGLFKEGETVAIGASGGKDSTVLIHVLTTLNRRHAYGVNLILVSVDEGIKGYRDDSLETVKRNEAEYGVPLKVVSYEQLYGWTMDEIVAHIGRTGNCTYCGVFRRQALERGAALVGADLIATGHNADDLAETVIMNLLRGDIGRLGRSCDIMTDSDHATAGIRRCKPLKYCYEKEIVMYAYMNKLDYFSTECVYSPFAFRGFAREFLKDLEAVDSATIINIIRSGEHFKNTTSTAVNERVPGACKRCGAMSSRDLCQACVQLDKLEALRKRRMEKPKRRPKVRVGYSDAEEKAN